MNAPTRATALAAACSLLPVAVLQGTALHGTARAEPGPRPEPPPATGNGSWSVGPANRSAAPAARPHFALQAPPGATVRDAVRIANLTDRPLTFRLYGADAYNTPRDAGFALRTADEPARDVGAWTRLGVRSLTLPPRTAKEVPFQIAIPVNATPGEHIGGIVALNDAVESVQRSGGARIGLRRAVAARVYLRVAGPAAPGVRADGLTVTRSEPFMPFLGKGRGTLRYSVANTGNLRIAPTAKVRATGAFGRTVKEWPDRRLPEILPGQSTVIDLPWEGTPPLDAVTVRVELTAPDGVVSRTRTGFVAVPWAALLTALGVVFLLWSVLPRLIRRWLRRAGLTSGPHEPASAHDLYTDSSYGTHG
ncbi:WxL protein peptidoglycan domain-containing protein [Spirillospora sp. NPDC127200]